MNISPKYYHIFSLRCSGSNYLESLIFTNFYLKPQHHIWKHRLILPTDFEGVNTSEILYIFLYRNASDWIRSFYNSPYHVPDELLNQGIGHFMRHEWWCWYDELGGFSPINPKYHQELIHERNPDTGERFSNVLQMRNRKLQSYLEASQKLPNVYFINYDYLKNNFEEVLKDISEKFHLPLKHNPPKNISTRNGFVTNQTFVPKTYSELEEEDQEFMNSQIDEEIEKSIIEKCSIEN